MFKIGFIGTGQTFNQHILGYLDNNHVNITALCDRSIEKAEEKKDIFDLSYEIPIYSDYKEMLDEMEFDIIEILLPVALHTEAVQYAAKKGVTVISVRKPIAKTVAEADKMIQTCEKESVLLSVYENNLFAPYLIKAKNLITKDYIGDISSIRIKIAIAGEGGLKILEGNEGSHNLFNKGWHAFALGWWVYNEPIEKVHAWAGNFAMNFPTFIKWKCKKDFNEKHIVPQYGNIEFVLIPEMEISSKSSPTDEFLEIIGSRGIMKINRCTAQGLDSKVFKPIIIIRDGKVETIEEKKWDRKQSFINATHHLIEVAKGKKAPILSGEDAREILKFNLAAIKSTEIGREVYLDEFFS
ncbi:MAG: Gfo/Idh/MocA family protein [Promethearchaeia archaeon]